MKKTVFVYAGLAFIALAGMAGILMATRWGPGVGGDATIYIESAKNLLAGHGLGLTGPQGEFRLLPYFPPFFSLVLAAIGFGGVDLVTAARWVNILSFGGLITLIGVSIYRSGDRWFFAFLAALLTAVSPVLVPVYSWAMSEPLSMLLGFGGLLILGKWLDEPEKKGYLYISALAAGLSFLTRYSSAAYLAAGGAGVLLMGPQKWRKNFFATISYLVSGAVPMAAWLIYDLSMTSTIASRSVESGAGMVSRFTSFWAPLGEATLFWLVPDSWIASPWYPAALNKALVIAVILLLAGWCGLILWKNPAVKNERGAARFAKMLSLLLLFMGGYLGMIFLVFLTTYPPITIGDRMLSPVHIAVLWVTVLLAALSIRIWTDKRWLQAGLICLLALGCLWYGGRSARIVVQYYETGLGYTSPAWRNSPTVAAVRDLPADLLLISNETNAILFLSGRPAYPLKEIYQDKPSDDFTVYGKGDPQDEAQEFFREGRAVLVLFDTIDDQMYGLYGERTGERITALVKGLRRSYRGDDGGIFYYATVP